MSEKSIKKENIVEMKLKKLWLKEINRELYRAEKAERKVKRFKDKARICRTVANDMFIEYERRFGKIDKEVEE